MRPDHAGLNCGLPMTLFFGLVELQELMVRVLIYLQILWEIARVVVIWLIDGKSYALCANTASIMFNLDYLW
jgi:hypothetical protein